MGQHICNLASGIALFVAAPLHSSGNIKGVAVCLLIAGFSKVIYSGVTMLMELQKYEIREKESKPST